MGNSDSIVSTTSCEAPARLRRSVDDAVIRIPRSNPGECCYDATSHANSSIVQSFPLSCLQLVCILEAIVPDTPFGDCSRLCCLDENDQLKENGATWFDSCIEYEYVDGEKNPTGNTADCGCVKDNGETVPNGEIWITDCVDYICEAAAFEIKQVNPSCCLTDTGYVDNGYYFYENCKKMQCISGVFNDVGLSPLCCNTKFGIKAPNETWGDDPCLHMQCRDGVITNIGDDPDCCFFGSTKVQNFHMLDNVCAQLTCWYGSWKFRNGLSSNCAACRVYDDPHMVNFPGNHLDFHGVCNYSLSQDFTSYNPIQAIYGKFSPCSSGASCLEETTFKDGHNTIIHVGHYGLDTNLYKLRVNGNEFQVPPTGVHSVSSGANIVHSVLAWKEWNSLHLLGRYFYMIHTSHQITIYAYKQANSAFCGLCSTYFEQLESCLASRPGAPVTGPESWKTDTENCSTTHRRHRRELRTCSTEDMDDFQLQCQLAMQDIIGNDLTTYGALLTERSSDCAFDMCQMSLDGIDNTNWPNICKEMFENMFTQIQATKDISACPTNPPENK